MPIRVNRKALIILAAALFAVAIATAAVIKWAFFNREERSREFLADARAYAAAGQDDLAVIQYRSAVKYDPDNTAAQIELGDVYTKLGDLNLAYECYRIAQKQQPANVEVMSKLADFYYLGGKWEDLRKTAAAIISLSPGGLTEARAHHYLAQAYYRDGDFVQAVNSFARAVALNADDVDAILSSALISAQKLGAGREAQLGLNALLARVSDESLDARRRAEAAVRAAKFYWAVSKNDEAESMLQTAISLMPSEAAYRMQAGDFYKRRGRDAQSLDLAERSYMEGVRVNPASAAAGLALGLFYRETGRNDKALEVFADYARKFPAPLAYQYLIESLIDKGDTSAALAEISSLRKLKNASSIADYLEGRLLFVESRGSGEKARRAEELLRKVVRQRPDFPPGHYYLGLALATWGMLDESAVEFQKALDAAPEFDTAALALAEVYIRTFQFDKAIAQARSVLGRDRDNYFANLLAGRALAAQGNVVGARSFLEQARVLKPAEVEPAVALADVLSRQGKTAEAASLLEAAAKNSAEPARLLTALSAVYERAGDTARALETAAAASATDSVSAVAYYANLLWQNGRAQDAIAFLARRADEMTARAEYRALLGDFQRLMGAPADAVASYELALKQDGSSERALAGLAAALTAQARFAGARDAVARLRQLDRGAAAADLAEAAIYLAEDKPDAAVTLLENSIRQNPSNSEAHYRLALVEERRGNTEKAVNGLRSALRLNPESVAARLALAQLYYKSRFYEDALREARAVVSASESGSPALNQATAIAVGSLVERRRVDEALAQWGALPPEVQGTGDYMLKLGYLHLMNADFARSVEDFRAAAAALKDPSPAFEGLARTYIASGDLDPAAATIMQALSAGPSDAARVRLLQLAATVNLARGNAQLAVSNLTEMRKAAGEDPALLVQAGDAFAAAGRDDLALDAYRAACAADSKYVPAQKKLVEALVRTDNLDEALAAADKGLKAGPGDIEWVALKARALFAQNTAESVREATRILGAALTTAQPGSATASARLLLATIQYRTGQTAAAESLLRKALTEDPGLSAARLLLARTLVANRSYEEASMLANEVFKEDPSSSEALAVLADVSILTGDAETAISRFKQALSIRKDPAILRALVATLGRLKKKEEAFAATIEYLRAVPSDTDIMRMLAEMYSASGNFEESQRILRELLAASPSDTSTVYALARAYKDQGKLAEAEAVLSEFIASTPTALAYRYLAGVQGLAGRLPDSEKTLRTAVTRYPEYLDAYSDLAAILAGSNRLPEAVAVMKQAVSGNRNREDAYVRLGRFYLDTGQEKDAEVFLSETVDRNPKFVTVASLLGEVYRRRGDAASALAIYEKAFKFSPDDPRAANALAYVLADTGTDVQRALKLAQFAASKLPENPDVLDTLGWAYFRDGQFANAVAALSQAVERSNPPGEEALFHLALAYAKVGASERAKTTANQLLKVNAAWSGNPDLQAVLSGK